MRTCHCGGINACALGSAVAVLSGTCLFLLVIFSHFFNYGIAMVTLLSAIYPGLDTSLLGAVIGLIYGLLFGFVGGWAIAKLYNCYTRCCAEGLCACCKPSPQK